MAITIHNLTNSPFDLLNDKGEKVRIAARGTIEGFKPQPSQLSIYRSLGYFRIEDAGQGQEPEQDQQQESRPEEEEELTLADRYRELTGKDPDKRWSAKRLRAEVEKLQ